MIYGGGAAQFILSDPLIINNTFVNNFTPYGGAININGNTNSLISNSVFYDNRNPIKSQIVINKDSKVILKNCLIDTSEILNYGTYEIENCILDGDCDFVDTILYSKFQPYSKCINNGSIDTLDKYLPEFDIFNNPRIKFGNIDIGAVEFNSTKPFVVKGETINIDTVIKEMTLIDTVGVYYYDDSNLSLRLLNYTDIFELRDQLLYVSNVNNFENNHKYKVEIEANNGIYKDTGYVFVNYNFKITKIDDLINMDLNYFIYPNPTDEKIQIKINSFLTEKYINIKIYNSFGAILYNENLSTLKLISLDVANYHSGLYFIKINNLKTVNFIKK